MGLGKAVSQVTLSFSRGRNDSFNSLSKFVIWSEFAFEFEFAFAFAFAFPLHLSLSLSLLINPIFSPLFLFLLFLSLISARSTLTTLSATPSSLEVGFFFLLHSQPLSLIQGSFLPFFFFFTSLFSHCFDFSIWGLSIVVYLCVCFRILCSIGGDLWFLFQS